MAASGDDARVFPNSRLHPGDHRWEKSKISRAPPREGAIFVGEREALVSRFSVDPEALRATAAQLDRVRDSAGAFVETCPAELGHADLAQATSRLAIDMADSWKDATEDLTNLSERLRQSADLYERTDQDLVVPGEAANG
ncbi:hypothetical protein [Microbacterium testaceum]|uniref:hypothetical protein n=1 Tax=Microbacterium testaceum TaxID=2033 RepID=UPI0038238201